MRDEIRSYDPDKSLDADNVKAGQVANKADQNAQLIKLLMSINRPSAAVDCGDSSQWIRADEQSANPESLY